MFTTIQQTPILRTVVLRHETPDGGFHFDWMLEPPAVGGWLSCALITFRIHINPVEWTGDVVDAIRLPDHRAIYLTYEGPLTDNRGTVARVAEGTVTFLAEPSATPERLDFVTVFEHPATPAAAKRERWSAAPRTPGSSAWRLDRVF